MERRRLVFRDELARASRRCEQCRSESPRSQRAARARARPHGQAARRRRRHDRARRRDGTRGARPGVVLRSARRDPPRRGQSAPGRTVPHRRQALAAAGRRRRDRCRRPEAVRAPAPALLGHVPWHRPDRRGARPRRRSPVAHRARLAHGTRRAPPRSTASGRRPRSWAGTGPTDIDNLVLVCRRHHVACHEGRWKLRRSTDGTVEAVPP